MNINEKLDKMNETLTEVRISQGRTEVNVAMHIKRTDIAEANIALIREELKPLKKTNMMINLLLKIIIAGSSLALFVHKMNLLPKF
jgi:hypothetical protein